MTRAKKERLDILVQRRANMTRSKAQGLILTGRVCGPDGAKLTKPGARLPVDTRFTIEEGPAFVSRGGEKLEAAFEAFAIDVSGAVAIDVGASTGGFTDCLLKHGAARVFAVDVGYGQLAWELRKDPRVVIFERTNIRELTPDRLGEPPLFFTADCSFISLRLVLPPVRNLLAVPAEGVVLVKPQFEAGREEVGKGGVVRNAEVREAVVEKVVAAARQLGFSAAGVIPSPLLGPAGNQEYLVHFTLDA